MRGAFRGSGIEAGAGTLESPTAEPEAPIFLVDEKRAEKCYCFGMIQIFGTNKSFDCKTAQRWFKERRIDFQFVDLKEKEMSRGEFDSVVDALARAEGGRAEAVEVLTDKSSKDYASIAYLDDSEKEDKLFENQLKLLKQPVCRKGKQTATVGLCQKIWETWK